MKHLLALVKKLTLYWVKWVCVYILKGQSLSGIPNPNEASWVIRKTFEAETYL